jgi:hypothetical protein
MPRTAIAVLLALILALSAACSGDDTPDDTPDPGAGPDAGGEDVDAVAVTPEAELEGSCEPLPQDGEDGQVLAADLVVRNTGNIGVVVRVVASWRQPGGHLLTASRRLRVEVGESIPVQLRIDVGARTARAVERMVERDRPCFTRVRVAGAFGAPRE